MATCGLVKQHRPSAIVTFVFVIAAVLFVMIDFVLLSLLVMVLSRYLPSILLCLLSLF